MGDCHVGLPVGQPSGGLEGSQAFRWKLATAGHREDIVHPTAALVQVTAHLPDSPEHGAQSHRLLGVARGYGPFQRRAEVVVVLLEPVKPLFSPWTKEMRLRLLRQRDEGLQMAIANQVGFATFLEQLHGEIANRLQHQEAWLIEVGKAAQQALICQLIERVDDIPADILRGAADRFELFQVAPTSEDRQARQQPAVAGAEHVVAPENCAAERLLPGRGVSPPAAERA